MSDTGYTTRQQLYFNSKQQSIQATKQKFDASHPKQQIVSLLKHCNQSLRDNESNIHRYSLLTHNNLNEMTNDKISEFDGCIQFMERMQLFEAEMKQFSTTCNLSNRIEAQIKSSLNEIYRLKQILAIDIGDDIEYILNIDALNWDFNQTNCCVNIFEQERFDLIIVIQILCC